jgi:hypothetical protein
VLTELEFTSEHLARFGQCFKGFNHIHKHQVMLTEQAWYAGSLCRLDWGEVEPKGYLEIAYGSKGWGGFAGDGPWDSAGVLWDYDVAFREIPVAPMTHIEGMLTRDGFACAAPTTVVGCDVRVRASYAQAEREVLATARERLTAMFPGARRLEIELIAVPDRVLRAPEVVQAKTFDEKLQAWARLSGVEWSDQIRVCADRLQATDDAEIIIRDVESRLQ